MATATRPTRNDRGFTLVELLVVVIIIGILAAVAVPVFLNQRTKAQDAQVKSALRNAALSVTTAMEDGTFRPIRELSGTGLNATLFVDENSGVKTLSAAHVMWNEVEGLPRISASDGVYMEIVNFGVPAGVAPWMVPHPAGEFCIIAMDLQSSYDWRQGDSELRYGRIAYYDSQLGGVRDLADVVKAFQDGRRTSCYGYADRFLAAGGTI